MKVSPIIKKIVLVIVGFFIMSLALVLIDDYKLDKLYYYIVVGLYLFFLINIFQKK
jgi:cell division protein FtsW (lipid II flippase)